MGRRLGGRQRVANWSVAGSITNCRGWSVADWIEDEVSQNRQRMKRRWWSVADEASPTTEGWSIVDELKRHQRRAKASPIGELKHCDGELKHRERRFEALRRRAKVPRWQFGLLKRCERRSKVPRWWDKVPRWRDKVPRRRAKAPWRRSWLLKHRDGDLGF